MSTASRSDIHWSKRSRDKISGPALTVIRCVLLRQVVMKQHKWYVALSFFVAFGVPLLLATDKTQALFFGGFAARCLTWHSTWCVNSLAHWLGSDEYSNETSAKV